MTVSFRVKKLDTAGSGDGPVSLVARVLTMESSLVAALAVAIRVSGQASHLCGP